MIVNRQHSSTVFSASLPSSRWVIPLDASLESSRKFPTHTAGSKGSSATINQDFPCPANTLFLDWTTREEPPREEMQPLLKAGAFAAHLARGLSNSRRPLWKFGTALDVVFSISRPSADYWPNQVADSGHLHLPIFVSRSLFSPLRDWITRSVALVDESSLAFLLLTRVSRPVENAELQIAPGSPPTPPLPPLQEIAHQDVKVGTHEHVGSGWALRRCHSLPFSYSSASSSRASALPLGLWVLGGSSLLVLSLLEPSRSSLQRRLVDRKHSSRRHVVSSSRLMITFRPYRIMILKPPSFGLTANVLLLLLFVFSPMFTQRALRVERFRSLDFSLKFLLITPSKPVNAMRLPNLDHFVSQPCNANDNGSPFEVSPDSMLTGVPHAAGADLDRE
ncbi:uncharacterized protein CLUP02_09079 [Colletotrichum lupini]|uniref:Uncharacterized protein n=1 Tax=Colletotrichum lupini TaxID=145971 RepID=A0A9Q8WI88_9PEZI|nr:uncharacterized protein CLUP02_09079 [Colletotrichum lupini]UQC83585.1 hypothetical protein CLUP02_09079 [Colletotrichum lupini]